MIANENFEYPLGMTEEEFFNCPYLLKEHIEYAAERGIKPSTVRSRYYTYNYNIRRAITEPTGSRQVLTKEERQTCLDNGIDLNLARARMRLHGWPKERAITEKPDLHRPKKGRKLGGRLLANGSRVQVIPLELRELAEERGIKYVTLCARLRSGWDEIEAATRKPDKGNGKKGKTVKKRHTAARSARPVSADAVWLAEEGEGWA